MSDQKSNLDVVRERMAEIKPELERLANLPGKLSGPQNARWRELTSEYDELDERRDDLQERADRAKAAGAVNYNTEREPGGNEYRDRALSNVERARFVADHVKEAATTILERADSAVSRYAAVVSDPAYFTAYTKLWSDPMNGHRSWSPEEMRAFDAAQAEQRTMTAGTGSSGGYLVPLYLDPQMTITGAGSVNPFRQVSTIKKITTLTYNGGTAGQITAGLLGENAVFSDNTPTVGQVQIPTYKIGAYIPASFEAFEDIDALAEDVRMLFADAQANYEATQFATGTGSAPLGVVAKVAATTASRVAPTTGGAYAVADVYKMHAALPARYRNGPPNQRAWMANVGIIDTTRQFATANVYHAFLTDLTGGQPANLIGDSLYEASAMSASLTTGQDVLIYGDFSRYTIVDRLGLTTEFVPNVFDTATGRPTGTRAWLTHWRVGADVADVGGLRVLRL